MSMSGAARRAPDVRARIDGSPRSSRTPRGPKLQSLTFVRKPSTPASRGASGPAALASGPFAALAAREVADVPGAPSLVEPRVHEATIATSTMANARRPSERGRDESIAPPYLERPRAQSA